MKRLRLSLAANVLFIAFAVSTAMAGQMPFGVTAPPPPTETSATGDMPQGDTSSSEASAAGDMPYGDTSAIDPVTGLALSLLKSLLSLF